MLQLGQLLFMSLSWPVLCPGPSPAHSQSNFNSSPQRVLEKINQHHTRLKISQNITCNFLRLPEAPSPPGWAETFPWLLIFKKGSSVAGTQGISTIFLLLRAFSLFFLFGLQTPTLCCPDTAPGHVLALEAWAGSVRPDQLSLGAETMLP